MKINQKAWCISVMVVLFSCNPTPLSYSADKIDSSSRQKLISIVNLTDESSANAVIQNNGVIEFQGNELVDSVAAKMSANGTLPPDSTLVLPDTRSMMINVKATETPLALVEKDLRLEANSKTAGPDALMGNATKISREPIGIPLGNVPVPNQPSPSMPDVPPSMGAGGSTGGPKGDG